MSGVIPVTFLIRHGRYNKGETIGVSKDEASELITNNVAANPEEAIKILAQNESRTNSETDLERELKKVNGELVAQRQLLEAAESKVTELEDKLAKSEKEAADLNGKTSEYETSIGQFKSELEKSNSELSSAKAEIEKLKKAANKKAK